MNFLPNLQGGALQAHRAPGNQDPGSEVLSCHGEGKGRKEKKKKRERKCRKGKKDIIREGMGKEGGN